MLSDHEEGLSYLFLPEELFDMTISGTEEEMLTAAVQHAVQAHGHRDTPALREQLRRMLRTERKKRAA